MANPSPTNDAEIYTRATQNYEGLVAEGGTIPVTMVTAPEMLTSKEAFKNSGNAFGTARNNVRSAYQVFDPAMLALATWLSSVRAVIARRIGERWNAAWAEAGWPGPSTAVPKTVAGRLALGSSLKAYFTANPSYEVPNMGITADVADDLTTTARNAQQTVATAEAALKTAGTVRKTNRKGVRGLMSALLANLNRKLGPDDPRWLAFGLRMPSIRTTPTAPTHLRATLMGTNVLLECDVPEYATRFRFRKKVVGIDTKFSLAASSRTPMVMIEAVAPGTTLEVMVQAVNGNAQSVPSDPIFVTIPVTAEAPVAAKPLVSEAELAPLAAIVPNGTSNGNGNGSHAVSRLS